MKIDNRVEYSYRQTGIRIPSASLALLAIASWASPASADLVPNNVRAALYNVAGERLGIAQLTQLPDEVRIVTHVRGLTPGFHGFHVHAVGLCEPDSFMSAGGHYKLDGQDHRDHAGDLPVLLVNADGSGKAKFRTDRFALADLFDADGSALIIHANPDNYANIPTARYAPPPDMTTLATGDAGARIACGVIGDD